jgi:hypothetical protein
MLKKFKKYFYFIIITKTFTTRKILKIENKHEQEKKKKFDFRNTLNRFIFQKFIP